AAASGARIETGRTVREIRRTAAGFRVVCGPVPDPTVYDADAVIVAAPAPKAAGMLRELVPAAAGELARIEYASTGLITLAYRTLRLPEGSGFLVPPTEGRLIKAVTFSSQKWPHLGGAIVRASVGRYGEARALQRDDGELAAAVEAELAPLIGASEPPMDVRVTRWGGALPQYQIGHLDRVRRIRTAVEGIPGLAVCGAAYDGVGVPACIRTGRQAAARIEAHLRRGGESSHG
ncbi:MAG TPA: protoporphyrinogen oxidase, partial [Mycobacteriales bacterium]|nr:protoporphyrinogen oxidase [Mycobacteriales bacterium]